MALLIYLDISGFILAQENISKKKHSYLSEPSPESRPGPHQPALAMPPARP
jgi:hypothetical protein